MKIPIADVRTEAGTQTRVKINEDTVTEYAEDMAAGHQFPPVIVYHDGTDYFMADGFHRILGAARNGYKEIEAEVRKGTRTDALIYALGANGTNGLRRTNADKRRCVEIALREFVDWSDRMIAEACGVAYSWVMDTRKKQVHAQCTSPTATRLGRDGKRYPATKPKSQKGATRLTKAERLVRIQDMAEAGFRADQIAAELEIGVHRVRLLAREAGIVSFAGKNPKPEANRIVAETVLAAQSLTAGLELVDSRIEGSDASLIPEWIQTLTQTVNALNRLINQLKKRSKHNEQQNGREVQQAAC